MTILTQSDDFVVKSKCCSEICKGAFSFRRADSAGNDQLCRERTAFVTRSG